MNKNMENYNEQMTQELEQLRQQMDILRRRLNEEMQLRMRNIHKYMDKVDAEMWINIRLPLFLTPLLVINLYNIGSSWWVMLLLVVLMGTVIGSNVYIRRLLNAHDWYTQKNLVETRQHVVKAHRLYTNWRFFDLSCAVVWMILLCYDLSIHLDAERMRYIWWGMAAGLLIGLPIGVYKFVKTSRHWDELLRNIREMEAEN